MHKDRRLKGTTRGTGRSKVLKGEVSGTHGCARLKIFYRMSSFRDVTKYRNLYTPFTVYFLKIGGVEEGQRLFTYGSRKTPSPKHDLRPRYFVFRVRDGNSSLSLYSLTTSVLTSVTTLPPLVFSLTPVCLFPVPSPPQLYPVSTTDLPLNCFFLSP